MFVCCACVFGGGPASFSAREHVGLAGGAQVQLRRVGARARRHAHVVHARSAAAHVDGLGEDGVVWRAEADLEGARPGVVRRVALHGEGRARHRGSHLLARVGPVEEVGGDRSAARRHGDG